MIRSSVTCPWTKPTAELATRAVTNCGWIDPDQLPRESRCRSSMKRFEDAVEEGASGEGPRGERSERREDDRFSARHSPLHRSPLTSLRLQYIHLDLAPVSNDLNAASERCPLTSAVQCAQPAAADQDAVGSRTGRLSRPSRRRRRRRCRRRGSTGTPLSWPLRAGTSANVLSATGSVSIVSRPCTLSKR